MTNLILAVPFKGLPRALRHTGFHPMAREQILATLQDAGLWLGPQPHLETDENFLQIIPYVVFRHGDRVLRYTRSPAGRERRLEGQTSIGIGGHIELADLLPGPDGPMLGPTIINTAYRESKEELVGVDVDHPEWRGLIVDLEEHVSRVHIAVAIVCHVKHEDVLSNDPAVAAPAFVEIKSLTRQGDTLESWSRMLVTELGSAAA